MAPNQPKCATFPNAGFGATDQANGRPFQVHPRPLRVRHTDTGPITATTRPTGSHQPPEGDRQLELATDPKAQDQLQANARQAKGKGSSCLRRLRLWEPTSQSRSTSSAGPMARSGCGSRSLDIELQQLLNPDPAEQVERFSWWFAPGDKGMRIANNDEKEAFKGDVGTVKTIDIDASELTGN